MGTVSRLLPGKEAVMKLGDIGVLALRGLAGGALVVVFALIGEVVKPKAFAGLFSAAPSVAVASLAITIVAENPVKARQASIGMVVGGVAMAVCCILAVVAIPRIRSLWGSLVAWLGWAAVDLGLYWAVFVGAH
jgi:hypothetical protein